MDSLLCTIDQFDFSRWPPVILLEGRVCLVMIVDGNIYIQDDDVVVLRAPSFEELHTMPGSPEYWH